MEKFQGLFWIQFQVKMKRLQVSSKLFSIVVFRILMSLALFFHFARKYMNNVYSKAFLTSISSSIKEALELIKGCNTLHKKFTLVSLVYHLVSSILIIVTRDSNTFAIRTLRNFQDKTVRAKQSVQVEFREAHQSSDLIRRASPSAGNCLAACKSLGRNNPVVYMAIKRIKI